MFLLPITTVLSVLSIRGSHLLVRHRQVFVLVGHELCTFKEFGTFALGGIEVIDHAGCFAPTH